MEDIKRILDSVHGYIYVPKFYIENIVDTIYFQRLRHIEQSSCRMLFPCAKHDRFTHSLGVFHNGCKIAAYLWDNYIRELELDEDRKQKIIISYILACLLHDVGHVPFSHTFEKFFEDKKKPLKGQLEKILREKFGDNTFADDYNAMDVAPHEIISAILSITKFNEIIEDPTQTWHNIRHAGDNALVARMITGQKYKEDGKDLENIFIELTHGKTIDADGLDYVSRDVWASGYATARVDIDRIIKAMKIVTNPNTSKLELCYDVKAINEIHSVINVKLFQQDYIFNNQKIVYEKSLLTKAMQAAALYHNKKTQYDALLFDETQKENIFYKFCDVKLFTEGADTQSTSIHIQYPMDADFISLMKYKLDNPDIKEWFSRQCSRRPIWKTKEQFIGTFSSDSEIISTYSWALSPECVQFVANNFNIDQNDIWSIEIKEKNRLVELNNIKILVNNHIKTYTTLYPKEKENIESIVKDFRYIFIPKKDRDGNIVQVEQIKNAIREHVLELHREQFPG